MFEWKNKQQYSNSRLPQLFSFSPSYSCLSIQPPPSLNCLSFDSIFYRCDDEKFSLKFQLTKENFSSCSLYFLRKKKHKKKKRKINCGKLSLLKYLQFWQHRIRSNTDDNFELEFIDFLILSLLKIFNFLIENSLHGQNPTHTQSW